MAVLSARTQYTLYDDWQYSQRSAVLERYGSIMALYRVHGHRGIDCSVITAFPENQHCRSHHVRSDHDERSGNQFQLRYFSEDIFLLSPAAKHDAHCCSPEKPVC